MKTSLFTQSLFSVSLTEAIDMAGAIGFEGIELACREPHLTLELARNDAPRLLTRIRDNHLQVSALSLFTQFTSIEKRPAELEQALGFIACAPAFATDTVKITPGPPASAEAEEGHWDSLQQALSRLVEAATEVGVRIAVETHLGQVSDRLRGLRRILAMDPTRVVGVNLDFCNLAFGGDEPVMAIEALQDRLYFTHVKNGYLGDGKYDFRALDDGVVNYLPVIEKLREVGFNGYLSVECLGPSARENPYETVRHDYEVLRRLLKK